MIAWIFLEASLQLQNCRMSMLESMGHAYIFQDQHWKSNSQPFIHFTHSRSRDLPPSRLPPKKSRLHTTTVEEPTATFQSGPRKQGLRTNKRGLGLAKQRFKRSTCAACTAHAIILEQQLALVSLSDHTLSTTPTSTDIGHHVFLSLYRYCFPAAANRCRRKSSPTSSGAGLLWRQARRFLLDIHRGAARY